MTELLGRFIQMWVFHRLCPNYPIDLSKTELIADRAPADPHRSPAGPDRSGPSIGYIIFHLSDRSIRIDRS